MSEALRWPRRIVSGAAKVFTTAAAATMAAAAFGIISARKFGIRYETVPLLAPGSKPFRILHVADMHLVADDRGKIAFVQQLAQLKPDLVVNTGDNPGGVDAIEDVVEALHPLFDVPGVFVPGSNDFYGPKPANPLRYLQAPTTIESADEWRDVIDVGAMFEVFTRRDTWFLVGNRTHTLKAREDLTIGFAGIHDAHMQADAWPGFDRIASPVDLQVAVTHAPYRRVLNAAIADGADLVFAGHTHGGQIALPHYGALVTNCDLPTGLASSLFSWRAGGNHGLVNVSAGIGTSPTVPLRTFCPPEAVVIDLVATAQGAPGS